MRVLILGVSGLLGHRLFVELARNFDTYGVSRRSKQSFSNLNKKFLGSKIVDKIDVRNFDILQDVFSSIKPDIILNCIGITKRKEEIGNLISAIEINSIFPHKIANWAKANSARVIHFSTDCVFDGTIGNYNEKSITSATDIYGKTKALGELQYDHTLTLRSSFIGQELFEKTELLEWFLAQKGKQIEGYTNVFYSGVSSIYMTKVVIDIISNFPNLSGIFHLATEKPISKFELLVIAKNAFKINIAIVPEDKHMSMPTLDGSKLVNELKLVVPPWTDMMDELADNQMFYRSEYQRK